MKALTTVRPGPGLQDGLAGAGVLVIEAVTGFDEGEAGQRVVLQVGVVLGEGRDVVGVDAEGIGGIADRRWRTGCFAVQGAPLGLL